MPGKPGGHRHVLVLFADIFPQKKARNGNAVPGQFAAGVHQGED